MSAIALPPNQTAFVRFLFDDDDTRPASQGREGRCVETAAREVSGHWTARPSYLVKAVKAHDDFAYEPVPMKIAGSVRVKYRLGGRLQPLPYPAD